MPTWVRVDLSALERSIRLKQEALSGTAIQARLGRVAEEFTVVLDRTINQRLSTSRTGNMASALAVVEGPWATARGWAIGLGPWELVGSPDDPAPRGTITAFLKWLKAQGIRNWGPKPKHKEEAWWLLPSHLRALLQKKRQEGMFGGGTGYAAGRAPYFWSQEWGNPGALIKAQGFAREAMATFEPRFRDIMTEGL